MRDAALVASSIIAQTAEAVRVGITTNELDMHAAKLVDSMGAKPFNLNYQPNWAKTPYPAVLCASVNNEIAHGIPDNYQLREGDIVTLDIGITYNGVCGDCAITVPVGYINKKHQKLLKAAKEAVYVGIDAIMPGTKVVGLANEIERYATSKGFMTCQLLSGHAIGEEMHQEPTLPNFFSTDERYLKRFGNQELEVGQVLCIEPILSIGDQRGKLDADGWTIVTNNKKFSAMYEHMVLVTETGCEVLTDHFVR